MKQLKMVSVGGFILLLLCSSIVYGDDSTTKSSQIIQASPDYQITSIPAAPISLIAKPTSSSRFRRKEGKEIALTLKTPEKIRELQRKLYQRAKQEKL